MTQNHSGLWGELKLHCSEPKHKEKEKEREAEERGGAELLHFIFMIYEEGERKQSKV